MLTWTIRNRSRNAAVDRGVANGLVQCAPAHAANTRHHAHHDMQCIPRFDIRPHLMARAGANILRFAPSSFARSAARKQLSLHGSFASSQR
jgi:hypothetical protein